MTMAATDLLDALRAERFQEEFVGVKMSKCVVRATWGASKRMPSQQELDASAELEGAETLSEALARVDVEGQYVYLDVELPQVRGAWFCGLPVPCHVFCGAGQRPRGGWSGRGRGRRGCGTWCGSGC